jgi:hypothetical protein
VIPVVVVGLEVGADADDFDVRMFFVPQGLGQPQREDKVLGNVVIFFKEEDNS